MTESSSSSPVFITPVFSANKYDKPTWSVLVNGLEVINSENMINNKKDAILERVDIGYGSDLSRAVFTLPRNPLLSASVPQEFDDVEVKVNGKIIFEGFISVKSDHVGGDGLKITYTALSNIAKFQENVVFNGSFNSENADFVGFPFILYTSKAILNIIGITATNIPNLYPGEVNITDKTLLEATESVLSKIGNYKLYYDMVNDSLDVYKFGSGGLNIRSFIPGKNIINYNINKSTENIVDKVVVIGPRIQQTVQHPIAPDSLAIAPNGRRELMFTLSGKNIRNITVEGQTREQPTVTYDNSVNVSKAMLIDPSTESIAEEIRQLLDKGFDSFGDSSQNTQDNDDFKLRPVVTGQQTYQSSWSQIPITIVPHKNTRDVVDVFLGDIPKLWYAHTIKGNVLKSSVGIPLENPEDLLETLAVEILDEFVFNIGSMRVTFTFDSNKPAITVGSGRITRSITDSQYQIISNNVDTSENNAGFITTSMLLRAEAEYARLHLPQISGSITVLGDETIDLRQTVFLEDQLLDIVHITHNFTNGFSTDVTITNEKLVPNITLRPFIPRKPNYETENEKRKGLIIINQDADVLKNKNQQAKNSSKKVDDPPQSSGPGFYL